MNRSLGEGNTPTSQVMIIKRPPMLIDIVGRLVTRRVTGDTDRIGVLVDPDIVEPQVRGHILADGVVLRREVVRHSQVHDQGHGLERDHALADVAVGSHCASVERPGLVRADEPGDVASGAGGVLEGEDLVFGSVVPAGVEVCQAGHGLLVDAAAVGVDLRDARVVYGGVVWFMGQMRLNCETNRGNSP